MGSNCQQRRRGADVPNKFLGVPASSGPRHRNSSQLFLLPHPFALGSLRQQGFTLCLGQHPSPRARKKKKKKSNHWTDVATCSRLARQAPAGRRGPDPAVVPPPRASPREDREHRHPSPRRRGLVRATQAASAQSRPRPALTSKLSRRIHPQLLPSPSSPLSFLGIQQPRAGKQPVIKASWEGGMEEAAAFLTKPERSYSATSFPSPCER